MKGDPFASNLSEQPLFETDTLATKVKKIIETELGCPYSEIKYETFFTDLGADSLDIVELVMAFEEEFEIDIMDEDVPAMRTVGAAIEYLRGRLSCS